MSFFLKLIKFQKYLSFLVLYCQALTKLDALVLDKKKNTVYSVDFNDLLNTTIEGEETFTLTEKNEIFGLNPSVMAMTSDGKKAIFITNDSQVIIRDMKEKTNGNPIEVKLVNLKYIDITPNNTYALLTGNYKRKASRCLTVINIKDNQLSRNLFNYPLKDTKSQ
jgi:PBP1b-binding outer membrane lipoprotein LpoB